MDLVKAKKELVINEKEYVMMFDMKSLVAYKTLTESNFNQGLNKLFNYDDMEILNFIAATLRHKETPDTPIGKEVFEEPLYFLINHVLDVIDIVVASLPKQDNLKKK